MNAADITAAATLLHTAVANNLIPRYEFVDVIDAFGFLLSVVEDQHDCGVLLSVLGTILKDYQPADTESLIEVLHVVSKHMTVRSLTGYFIYFILFQFC